MEYLGSKAKVYARKSDQKVESRTRIQPGNEKYKELRKMRKVSQQRKKTLQNAA
jgi:hypothetical protein